MYRASAQGIAERLLRGSSACWIALGGPLSGKTFAAIGELGEFARMGIVPRVASDILDKLSSPSAAKAGLTLTISCFTVHGGHVDRHAARDLLASRPINRPVVVPSAPRAGRQSSRGADAAQGDAVIEGLISQKVAVLSDVLLALERARRVTKDADPRTIGHLVTILSLRRETYGRTRSNDIGDGTSAPGLVEGGNVLGSIAVVDVSAYGGQEARKAAEELEDLLSAVSSAEQVATDSTAFRKQLMQMWSPQGKQVLPLILWPICRKPGAIMSILVTLSPDASLSEENSAAALRGSRILSRGGRNVRGCSGAKVVVKAQQRDVSRSSSPPHLAGTSEDDDEEVWRLGLATAQAAEGGALGGGRLLAEVIQSDVHCLSSPVKQGELHRGLVLQHNLLKIADDCRKRHADGALGATASHAQARSLDGSSDDDGGSSPAWARARARDAVHNRAGSRAPVDLAGRQVSGSVKGKELLEYGKKGGGEEGLSKDELLEVLDEYCERLAPAERILEIMKSPRYKILRAVDACGKLEAGVGADDAWEEVTVEQLLTEVTIRAGGDARANVRGRIPGACDGVRAAGAGALFPGEHELERTGNGAEETGQAMMYLDLAEKAQAELVISREALLEARAQLDEEAVCRGKVEEECKAAQEQCRAALDRVKQLQAEKHQGDDAMRQQREADSSVLRKLKEEATHKDVQLAGLEDELLQLRAEMQRLEATLEAKDAQLMMLVRSPGQGHAATDAGGRAFLLQRRRGRGMQIVFLSMNGRHLLCIHM